VVAVAADGGDDGDGDGVQAEEVVVAAAMAGQPAEVDPSEAVGHPEKLPQQRPSCRHSTANQRRSE
jgi:hypothetical protein